MKENERIFQRNIQNPYCYWEVRNLVILLVLQPKNNIFYLLLGFLFPEKMIFASTCRSLYTRVISEIGHTNGTAFTTSHRSYLKSHIRQKKQPFSFCFAKNRFHNLNILNILNGCSQVGCAHSSVVSLLELVVICVRL